MTHIQECMNIRNMYLFKIGGIHSARRCSGGSVSNFFIVILYKVMSNHVNRILGDYDEKELFDKQFADFDNKLNQLEQFDKELEYFETKYAALIQSHKNDKNVRFFDAFMQFYKESHNVFQRHIRDLNLGNLFSDFRNRDRVPTEEDKIMKENKESKLQEIEQIQNDLNTIGKYTLYIFKYYEEKEFKEKSDELTKLKSELEKTCTELEKTCKNIVAKMPRTKYFMENKERKSFDIVCYNLKQKKTKLESSFEYLESPIDKNTITQKLKDVLEKIKKNITADEESYYHHNIISNFETAVATWEKVESAGGKPRSKRTRKNKKSKNTRRKSIRRRRR